MIRPVLITLAALLAVTFSDVLPHSYIPSQNSASSISENHSAGSVYNQNSYARDDSKIRQHSTTFTNNAENSRDVATAISEPVHFPAIEPLPPHYLLPIETLSPHFGIPVENVVPFYSQPAEFTYPYISSPVESYPYVGEQGYYGFPSNIPYSAPTIGLPADMFYPSYTLPHASVFEAQPIPYSIPSIGVPLYQPGNIIGETFMAPAVEFSPLEYIDTTLLEAFYPELPIQTHFSSSNKFKTASASANPISSQSQVVSDNTAFSKDSIPILAPKKH